MEKKKVRMPAPKGKAPRELAYVCVHPKDKGYLSLDGLNVIGKVEYKEELFIIVIAEPEYLKEQFRGDDFNVEIGKVFFQATKFPNLTKKIK